MKNFFIISLLVLLCLGFTQAQFIRKWEKSAALGNLPSWFSTTSNLQRGIAYTPENSNPRLLVIADPYIPIVIILDAMTGDSVGTLNTAGISGGIMALNDICSSYLHQTDNKIYGCNLTTNAVSDHFKIYMWENISSAPQVVVIDSVSNFRLGDRLTVHSENWTLPNKHLITGSSGSNKILDYLSASSNPPFTRNEITLSDGNQGNNLSVDFNRLFNFFSGGYFVNSDDHRPRLYNTSGVLQFISPDSSISPFTNSIKFYSNGSLCCDFIFYVTYNYNGNYADLVMSYMSSYEQYWGHTSTLGNNLNSINYGDVEYTWRTSDSLYVFVISGNNGIGAYFAKGVALPVELISFTAEVSNSDIIVNWITASEVNNKGFEVERKSSADDNWENLAFVQGKGTTTERTSYSFRDSKLAPGNYSYRLKQIDFDGSFEYSETIAVSMNLPYEYSLEQNYPNPFNPGTSIAYQIPFKGNVSLILYDILGNKKAILVDELQEPGNYLYKLDGSGLSSGVYIYQLKSGSYISSRKMLLIK